MSMPKAEWRFLLGFAINFLDFNFVNPEAEGSIFWTYNNARVQNLYNLGQEYGIFEQVDLDCHDQQLQVAKELGFAFKLTKTGMNFYDDWLNEQE